MEQLFYELFRIIELKLMDSIFPRIELRLGYSISRIIKGGWQLAGGHGQVDEKQSILDMRTFVENGITTFDCADIYTGVEDLIGKFLNKYKHEFTSGGMPSIQVHTKFVPDLDELPRLTKAYTESIIDRSLRRLRVERLDMVQLHWWDFSIPLYIEAARYLLELQKAGKIRYIGVTNFDASHLNEIIEAGIPVISNQVQYSVLDQRPEGELQKLARKHNIFLLCYGAIAGGFLNEHYLGASELQEPLENRSLLKYKLIIEEFGGFEMFQRILYTLKQTAEKYNVGISEIAVSYILHKPSVAGVIIGARNAVHLESIIKTGSIVLKKKDLQNIHELIVQAKDPQGPVYGLERDRTGKHGKIMKYNLNRQGT